MWFPCKFPSLRIALFIVLFVGPLRASVTRTSPVPEEKKEEPKASQTQQVSQVADTKLASAATGYGSHKGHKGHEGHSNFEKGHHESSSNKGKKGFESDEGHSSSDKGGHGKKGDSGFHDKGGKKYKGAEHKSKFHSDFIGGKKGGKGHKHGEKGHKKKGNNAKGFKKVYHTEESGESHKFYEDSDSKKHFKKYDKADSHFKSVKGGKKKGGESKGGKAHDAHGSKGFQDKGSFHDSKKASKGSHGDKKHYDKDSSHGEKGSHKSSHSDGGKGYGDHGSHSVQHPVSHEVPHTHHDVQYQSADSLHKPVHSVPTKNYATDAVQPPLENNQGLHSSYTEYALPRTHYSSGAASYDVISLDSPQLHRYLQPPLAEKSDTRSVLPATSYQEFIRHPVAHRQHSKPTIEEKTYTQLPHKVREPHSSQNEIPITHKEVQSHKPSPDVQYYTAPESVPQSTVEYSSPQATAYVEQSYADYDEDSQEPQYDVEENEEKKTPVYYERQNSVPEVTYSDDSYPTSEPQEESHYDSHAYEEPSKTSKVYEEPQSSSDSYNDPESKPDTYREPYHDSESNEESDAQPPHIHDDRSYSYQQVYYPRSESSEKKSKAPVYEDPQNEYGEPDYYSAVDDDDSNYGYQNDAGETKVIPLNANSPRIDFESFGDFSSFVFNRES